VSTAGHNSATVAVVTGSWVEARCLQSQHVRIACSGGSAERARSEAARLVVEGAAALVSFGLAGGLAPELRPGDLLLPETVRSAGAATWSVDPIWRERVHARLIAGGLEPRSGALLGSERLLASAFDKRELLETSGARAVDMESHEVAVVATDAKLPFLVIRALADPYDQVIPQVAREALRPDGRVRLQAMLGGLFRERGSAIALIRLVRRSARGLVCLRGAAAAAGPGLGFHSPGGA
jgi:hopanoid-associated phosphorylase